MKPYPYKRIEKKWQKVWEETRAFRASDSGAKPKYYVLTEFPYPSGQGLHVGHIRSFTAMDIISRKRRMEGYDVLYPTGWDAFGLPTENYAIKTGIDPRAATKKNTDTFRKQMKSLGFSFDWEREVDTTDPAYYKWTQWLFLRFFKKGLAYKAEADINWCPNDKIGLANEEVIGGKCERCGATVEKRKKAQWMLKITAYADKLLEGLDHVDFLPEIKTQQRNWIGRSEGAEVLFDVEGTPEKIVVFTTRLDTIFSGTFVVLAPEHELISKLKNRISNFSEVEKYADAAKKESEEERIEDKEKTGVELKGIKAINPATGELMPVWTADFVLGGYGTGAVFADAHDERDFAFAKKYGIPLKVSIRPANEEQWKHIEAFAECFTEEGTLVNSGEFDGLGSAEARKKILTWLGKKGGAREKVQYHLRDWVFSRQRYWGEPIPIVHCEMCGYIPVPEKDLPLVLPKVKNYKPTDDGESPLSKIASWVETKCPKCKGAAKRETDVMPNWAGSSWYFLRYTDPENSKEFASMKKLKHWMPVDWYNGGMEHVTLHLLYSRFWNQFLYDEGLVPFREPYRKRTAQGMILGEGGMKMSKSRGNVMNPDLIVDAYGADVTRIYEMFMGPFDQAIAWDAKGIEGAKRFVGKVWRIGKEKKILNGVTNAKLEKLLNATVKKVGDDMEKMAFHTAISAMMVFVNACEDEETIPRSVWAAFLAILAPFAPHLAEELWSDLGNKKSVHRSAWPAYDPRAIMEETVTIVIQVNGKVRGQIEAKRDTDQKETERLALEMPKIQEWIAGKTIRRTVFVKNRLINFVV